MFFFGWGVTPDLSSSEDDAWQEPLRTVEVGGSVNLTCQFTKKRITTIIWLRQKLGEKPHVIATSYQLQPATFYQEFENNIRFDIEIEPFMFNLRISNAKLSDSATYYCAITFLYDITFGQGTVLIVKGKKLLYSQLLLIYKCNCSVSNTFIIVCFCEKNIWRDSSFNNHLAIYKVLYYID